MNECNVKWVTSTLGAGVPVLRRRHEPGADGRRDAGHVPEGAVSRYVGVPPAARARAPPARAAHRAPEPPRAPAREPPPGLTPPSHSPHPPHLRGRPLTNPYRTGVPTSPNVTDDTTANNAANQTVLWARVPAHWGDAGKEAVCHAAADDACFISACVLLRHVGSYILVREHQSDAVDVQYSADGAADCLAGRVRVRAVSSPAGHHDIAFPHAVHVPHIPVLPGRLTYTDALQMPN